MGRRTFDRIELRRSGDLKTTIPYRRVGMRLSRSDQVARGEAELAKQVARGRAAPIRSKLCVCRRHLRSNLLVRPLKPFLKRRHGILQLPLTVTGLQFPRLFKNGLDVVVVAVVRPEVAVVVRTEARLDDLVRSGARYLISGNLPLFAFDLRLRLVRVSARARS